MHCVLATKPRFISDCRFDERIDAILADGSQIEARTFTCFVNWFGEERRVEVIANDGDYPLLGVGLLLGLELRANYHTMELVLSSQ